MVVEEGRDATLVVLDLPLQGLEQLTGPVPEIGPGGLRRTGRFTTPQLVILGLVILGLTPLGLAALGLGTIGLGTLRHVRRHQRPVGRLHAALGRP